MNRLSSLAAGTCLALALFSAPPAMAAGRADLRLAELAPDADPNVLSLALQAMRCAQGSGAGTNATRLAVIDYSRPSLQKRLWVFDLAQPRLLFEEYVAHGSGSGDNLSTRFSNDSGSHASSLGLFVTGATYTGQNGLSLRLDGLERGVNDAAMARAIVMHGADYVNADGGRRMGRLGRSWGCPAVRRSVARPMIETLKDGQFLFSYYPDRAWLTRSQLLNCRAAHVAGGTADKARPPG